VALVKTTFHPDASEDYAAAFSWYYKRGTVLASNFGSEIDRAIQLISHNPWRRAKFDSQRRRFIVRKFPYSIIYEVHGESVVVLAAAHGKRRPYYWQERVSDQ
jgi:plasmid stabilization system protein ParE